MGVYRKVEDKYYKFMDWLDAKGLPVYKAIDAIETHNIPSFPFFALLCVLIIAGLYLLLVPGALMGGPTTFSVKVLNPLGNAVEGAKVSFLPEGESKLTETTNEEGLASIEVALGTAVKLNIEAEGFERSALSVTVKEAGYIEEVTLSELGPFDMKFQLFKAGTSELMGEEVRLDFACSESDWTETEFVLSGEVEVSVPRDCGEVIVYPRDMDCTTDCAFDLSNASPEIYLEAEERGQGVVFFSVVDEEFEAVAGIRVSVLEDGSTISFDYCITGPSGGCSIEGLPLERYWVKATDSLGNFASYDSSIEYEFVELNENNTSYDFPEIVLERGALGEITVRIQDSETGNAVDKAEVSLYDLAGVLEQTAYTGSSGEVVFKVGDNKKFNVSVDAPGYILKAVSELEVGETRTVSIEQATSENSQSVEVVVLDERDEPIENVRLYLKKAVDYSVVGNPLVTGADGTGVFKRVEEGTYVVYAEKIGFKGKTSGEISVQLRSQEKVTIRLSLGRGSIKLNVVDQEQQPVQGVSITAFDYFTDEEMPALSALTGVDGTKEFADLRADKKVYFVIGGAGFNSFTTVPLQVTANSTAEKEVQLDSGISKFEVKLLGLYLNGERISELMDSGTKYKALFQVRVPEGSSFSQAGIHLRTGDETEGSSNAMEKDSLYIKKVIASGAKIIKGTSFTSPNGYASDSKNLTSGDAKWVNVVFGRPSPGILEVEAEIQIRENASLGQSLEIHYRGWGLAGGYLRHPSDGVLGREESTSEKQSLYANALTEIYGLGPTTLCNDQFCAVLSVEDLDTKVKSTVLDQFPAEISADYKMSFRLTSVSDTIYSNSAVELVSGNKGLELKNYEITDVSGQRSAGNAEGYSLSVPVGELRKGLSIQGFVELRTKKEGTNKLALNLLSDNEKKFNKTLKFEVSAAQRMTIETIPLIVVPFIENDLLVRVSDEREEGIGDATVRFWINDELAITGNTDAEGVFKFILEGVAPGTVARIETEKNGYKSEELEIQVDEQVLEVTPNEVSEGFKVTADYSVAKDFTVRNLTEIPLRIKALDVHGEVTDYISFIWQEDFIGEQVTKEGDLQLEFKMKMKEKAKELIENESFEGSISIVVESEEFGKQFSNQVPVKVSVGMPGSVDDPDCLELTQQEWKISTKDDVVENTVTLLNLCTSEGEAIPLRNLSAKVTWVDGNPIGEFELNPEMAQGKTITLVRKFNEFAPTMDEDSETQLKFSFNPDVLKSAAGKARIEIQAINASDSGEEEIETMLDAVIYVNDLVECLSIEPDAPYLPILLAPMPFNTGYGQTNQYFGYQPGMTGSYYNQGAGANYTSFPIQPNAQMRFQPWQQMQYPYNGYGGSGYDSQNYNSNYNMNWGAGSTGKAEFKIINNCEAPIEIELETEAAIMAKPSSILINPNQEEEVEVTSTYYVGEYGIKVKAGVKDSTEKKTEIDEVRVRVEREDFSGQDCIILDRRVFQFNDFLPKPIDAKIINQCYSTGWMLDYRSISVPMATGYTNPSMNNPYAKSGMIRDIQVVGLTSEVGTDGKAIQVLRFRIWKDPGIIKALEPKHSQFPTNNNPMAEIGSLRMQFAQGYYLVQAPEVLIVSFTTRQGARQTIPFEVRIEDYWPLLGMIPGDGDDDDDDKDDKELSKEALEKVKKMRDEGKTEEEAVEAAKEIEGNKWNPDKDKQARETFNKNVCGEKGLTGTGAYEKFGLDKLLFSWDPEKIEKDACDKGSEKEMFCDAMQFSVGLEAKMFDAFTFVQKLKDCEEERLNDETQEVCKQDSKNMFRHAKESKRIIDSITQDYYEFFMKSDTELLESAEKISPPQGNTTFIEAVLSADRSPIDNPKTFIEQTKGVIDALGGHSKSQDIVAIIEYEFSDAGFESFMKGIGADELKKAVQGRKGTKVLTFNEFKDIRAKLKAANEVPCVEGVMDIGCCLGGVCKIEANDLRLSVFEVSVEDLQKLFAGIEFMVGVRNKAGLSDADETKVIDEAKDKDEAKGFKDMYYADIDFSSNLIRDGFTDDFKSDFDLYLKSPIPTTYSFKTEARSKKVEAGQHKVFLDYTNWGESGKFEVSISLEKGLAKLDSESKNKYAENYFFQLPFDGTVGETKDGEYHRQGYGYAILGEDKGDSDHMYITGGENALFAKVQGENKVNALEVLEGILEDNFEEVRDGQLLSIKSGNFRLSPSTPVELVAELPGKGEDGLFYELKGDDSSKNASHLFNWVGKDKEITKDEKQNMVSVCNEDSERVGFKFNSAKGNDSFWTLFVVPINEEFDLGFKCAKENYTSTVKAYLNGVLTGSATVKGNDGDSIDNVSGNKKNYVDFSVKDMLDKVKDNEVCFSPVTSTSGNATGVELWWNPNGLADKIDEIGQEAEITAVGNVFN